MTGTVLSVPSEADEQMALVRWLEVMGLKFTAVPNSTYTTSWRQKAKNTATGLRAGYPDMIVLIPPDRSLDGLGHHLCIEMKRIKGSVTSPEQKAWIAAINDLNTPSVMAAVCHGFDEAKEAVESFLLASMSSVEIF